VLLVKTSALSPGAMSMGRDGRRKQWEAPFLSLFFLPNIAPGDEAVMKSCIIILNLLDFHMVSITDIKKSEMSKSSDINMCIKRLDCITITKE
jgi:hypothetical protein